MLHDTHLVDDYYSIWISCNFFNGIHYTLMKVIKPWFNGRRYTNSIIIDFYFLIWEFLFHFYSLPHSTSLLLLRPGFFSHPSSLNFLILLHSMVLLYILSFLLTKKNSHTTSWLPFCGRYQNEKIFFVFLILLFNKKEHNR